MKLRKILAILVVAVIGFLGMTTVNAATLTDQGKYALLLTSDEMEPTIDGEYVKLIRFNVAEGETTVKVSELVKGISPFNAQNEFSHWKNDNKEKVGEELKLTDFTKEGNFYTSTGAEITYTNGFWLSAKFEGKSLNETGKYYVVIDAFGGTVNGKAKLLEESEAEEFKTIDLTKYTPVRKGYTFKGWDLNGKIVTVIDSTAFAKESVINLTATYTKDTFDGSYVILKLDANGGTIDGEEANKYDYVGGGNSGTSMSLLPYVPVREGYTFNGWNTKKDGTGKSYKYMYWAFWRNDESYESEFERNTLNDDKNMYKNITLYATWTKNTETSKDTIKEITSTGEIKANVEFADEVSKNYKLDIKNVEVKDELAAKNVKFIADINVLNGNDIVKINNTKLKIKIALPDDLKGFDKYEVVYISDGEIKETISASIEDGYIVFFTTHLSEYGIVATNEALNNNETNPDTGDSIVFYVAFTFILVVSIASVYAIKKRFN